MTAATHVDATVYLQVEPIEATWIRSREDEPRIESARVKRMTTKRPEQPLGGTVLVKLTLRLPVAAFRPMRPEAIVVVPDSLTELSPVEVVAEDPHAVGGEL